jgi:hypothetical protein
VTQQRADYPSDHPNKPNRQGRERETADHAADQVKGVAEHAQEIAGSVAEHARQYGEKAQEVGRNFKPYVVKSMKEQPIGTLAVAAVIGFALGALWKR